MQVFFDIFPNKNGKEKLLSRQIGEIFVKIHVELAHFVGVGAPDIAEQMGGILHAACVLLIGITQDKAVVHAVAHEPRVGGRIGELAVRFHGQIDHKPRLQLVLPRGRVFLLPR